MPAEPPVSGIPRARPGVLLAVRDLFFRVKLETGLTNLGMPFRACGASGAVGVAAAAREERPEVVILDLSDAALEPLAALRALRSDPALADLPVIGFASHVDRDLRAAAAKAGCSRVVTRSRISATLPELLAPFLAAPDAPPA
jgi:CheY-like chemotaxis protein